jgi:uncharacterized protein (DUF433 family)
VDVTEIAPRIVVDEKMRFGKPVIAGTRVPVDLVAKLAAGMMIEELGTEYGITPEDVRVAMLHAKKTEHQDLR